MRRLTTEEFVKRATKRHRGKYNYSKVEYKNSKTKVCIICSIHKEFWQAPGGHCRDGYGCKECADEKNKINSRKITTEDFVKKAIKIHKNRYDYKKVRYINNRIKVRIICTKHGEWLSSPSKHLQGRNCPICSFNRIDTKEFIIRSIKTHGKKYNYDKVKYINNTSKVTILCRRHGEWEVTPANHMKGKECLRCSNEKRRSTTEDFIKKAIKKYGDKYDYSNVKYIGCDEKIIIICNNCNEKFLQIPSSHLNGRGCKKCGIKKRSRKRALTKENFIKKAKAIHSDKYNYSKVKYYENNSTYVELLCNKHKLFKQKAGSHLNGNGCPDCAIKNATKTTKKFIEEAIAVHGGRYDYSKVEYSKYNIPVVIICKEGHKEFKQSPSVHLSGCGCSHCKFKSEGKVKNILTKYFSQWTIIPNKKIWHKYKNYNHKRYCDFWLEKDNAKIMVEYDGRQHFEPVAFGGMSLKKAQKSFENYQLKDKLDAEFCEENNIILHRIKYDENKEESIKQLLSTIQRKF